MIGGDLPEPFDPEGYVRSADREVWARVRRAISRSSRTGLRDALLRAADQPDDGAVREQVAWVVARISSDPEFEADVRRQARRVLTDLVTIFEDEAPRDPDRPKTDPRDGTTWLDIAILAAAYRAVAEDARRRKEGDR